jgi:hypothetical protein
MELSDFTGLDTHEAARVLALEPNTLAVWRARGTGPPVHYSGTKPTYRLSELLAWQAECTAKMRERSERSAANGKRGRGRPKR